jgi:hypothetical protein
MIGVVILSEVVHHFVTKETYSDRSSVVAGILFDRSRLQLNSDTTYTH